MRTWYGRILFPVIAIAINSFREAFRNRVMTSLLIMPILMIGAVSLLGEMSLHNEVRVAKDVGYFFTSTFSVLISIYASVVLFHTEMERKTIYTLLSKPVFRWQFLLGKLLGVQAISFTVVVSLAFVSAVIVQIQGGIVGWNFVWAFSTVFLQTVICASLTILFATFSGSLISGLFAFGLYVAGNLTVQIEMAIAHFRSVLPALVPILEVLAILLPDYAALNLSLELTYDYPISSRYLVTGIWYSLSYSFMVFLFSVILFERKELQ